MESGQGLDLVTVADESGITMVAELARRIWNQHYPAIIGQAQVDYMLARFQSPAAIRQHTAAGQIYQLAMLDAQAVGYLALIPEPTALMISKIYVAVEAQGQGIGRLLLQSAIDWARKISASTIWLKVNHKNDASIAWYQRQGFVRTGTLVTDIGGGYVMDDYRLERTV